MVTDHGIQLWPHGYRNAPCWWAAVCGSSTNCGAGSSIPGSSCPCPWTTHWTSPWWVRAAPCMAECVCVSKWVNVRQNASFGKVEKYPLPFYNFTTCLSWVIYHTLRWLWLNVMWTFPHKGNGPPQGGQRSQSSWIHIQSQQIQAVSKCSKNTHK